MEREKETSSEGARLTVGARLKLARAGLAADARFPGHHLAEPELLDLSIDSSLTLELARRRTIAYIDVRLPADVIIHRGVRQYIKAHLAGRNAICFEEDGLLRTGFAVEDHSPETMGKVAMFADQLGQLFRSEDVVAYPQQLPGTPGQGFLSEMARRVAPH